MCLMSRLYDKGHWWFNLQYDYIFSGVLFPFYQRNYDSKKYLNMIEKNIIHFCVLLQSTIFRRTRIFIIYDFRINYALNLVNRFIDYKLLLFDLGKKSENSIDWIYAVDFLFEETFRKDLWTKMAIFSNFELSK